MEFWLSKKKKNEQIRGHRFESREHNILFLPKQQPPDNGTKAFTAQRLTVVYGEYKSVEITWLPFFFWKKIIIIILIKTDMARQFSLILIN